MLINLGDTELEEEQKPLLNFRPNFVSTTKEVLFMEIITATETYALNLNNSNKEIGAKCTFSKWCSQDITKNNYKV